jgi:uncharacterized protein DUF2510
MSSSPTPPGWYPDGHGNTRYWNGAGWANPSHPVTHPFMQPGVPPFYGPPAAYPSYQPPAKSHALAIIGGVVGLLVLIGVVGGGIKAAQDSGSGGTPGVSRGAGAEDASGDVVLGTTSIDSVSNLPSISVTITNHSSKRSDYSITLAIEASHGSQQVDTADIFVQNLEPGQSTRQEATFLGLDGKLPSDAVVKLQSVQRTAAY